MLKDKRGQWARAMARERRSQERRERLGMTKEMLKQGLTSDDIAYKLGLSGNTVCQYIREVGHLADAEQNIDTLLGRITSISNQMKDFSGTSDPANLKKFVKLGIDNLHLMVSVKLEREAIGEQFNSIIVRDSIESLYASIYSTVIISVYSTFLDERNRKEYSNEEREQFKVNFDKWMSAIKRGSILKHNYEQFLKEAQQLAEKGIVPKLPNLIKKIEEKMGFKELIKEIDTKIRPIIEESKLRPESIRLSGVYVYDLRKIFLSAKIPLLIFGMFMMVGSPTIGFISVASGIGGYAYQLYLEKKIRLKNKLEVAKKNHRLKKALTIRLILTVLYVLWVVFSIFPEFRLLGGLATGFVLFGFAIMGIWHYENKLVR